MSMKEPEEGLYLLQLHDLYISTSGRIVMALDEGITSKKVFRGYDNNGYAQYDTYYVDGYLYGISYSPDMIFEWNTVVARNHEHTSKTNPFLGNTFNFVDEDLCFYYYQGKELRSAMMHADGKYEKFKLQSFKSTNDAPHFDQCIPVDSGLSISHYDDKEFWVTRFLKL